MHARTRRALDTEDQPIGERDLVIAATALAHSLTVATGNVREFGRVAGLAVEDWMRQGTSAQVPGGIGASTTDAP